MTTIVNTPPASNDNGGNYIGPIIGFFVFIVAAYLIFTYGIPTIKNIQLGTPQINVPSKIDINVKQVK